MDRFVRRQETPEQRERRLLRMAAAPGPEMHLEDLSGFRRPPDWAANIRDSLCSWTESGKDLSALLVCAGADAPSYALQDMAIPNTAEVWDIDPSLKPGLLKLHCSSKKLRLGPVMGDILRYPCSYFGSANVLVAGPPCPPWSTMGAGKSFDDPRAKVFDKVLEIVEDQAWRDRSSDDASDAFFMFLLENVEGMLKRSRVDREADRPCPAVRVLHRLEASLPSAWDLALLRVDTSHHGLPQKRGRVYLRGVHRGFLVQQGDLQNAFAPARQIHSGLSSIIRSDLPNTNKTRAGRGNKYMENLRRYKVHHAAAMQSPLSEGMVAVVDLSRDRSCEYGEIARFDDRCVCLTASNDALWVFSLGVAPASLPPRRMPDVDLPIDRWLHPCERAALQGFPPDMRVKARDAVRVFGNAMSVPVVGLIMYPVLLDVMPAFLQPLSS